MIDLFPSKHAGIAGMVVSFSIARGIARPEGRSDPKKKVALKNYLTFVHFSCRRFVEKKMNRIWQVTWQASYSYACTLTAAARVGSNLGNATVHLLPRRK